MPSPLRILLRIAVFAAVFIPSVTPSWWLIEKLWTRDVSSEHELQPGLFVVLIRQPDHANRYAIDFYPRVKPQCVEPQSVEPQSKLVTDFTDQELGVINRDLRASISAETSNYVYFKILHRGQGYVDVSLEAPTTGDFWRKNSYRIQNGEVLPQRIIFYGPVFGMITAVLPISAGVLGVLGCNVLIRRRQKNINPIVL
jgi:hypothetical protein